MSRPVILRPDAELDIQITYIELEQVRTGLGMQFTAQLRVVLERIESMPELHFMNNPG